MAAGGGRARAEKRGKTRTPSAVARWPGVVPWARQLRGGPGSQLGANTARNVPEEARRRFRRLARTGGEPVEGFLLSRLLRGLVLALRGAGTGVHLIGFGNTAELP